MVKMVLNLIVRTCLTLFVLHQSLVSSYHHHAMHHNRMAHFHMEDRSPAIELHATDDGVHVRTNPASLDVASNLPQSHDLSERYSFNRYNSNRWRGGRGSRSRGRWNRNRQNKDYNDRDRGYRGDERERDDDEDDDDDVKDDRHKEADKKEIHEEDKAPRESSLKRPDMNAIAPLRHHLDEPIKYEGEPYRLDPFAERRGLSGFKRHGGQPGVMGGYRGHHRRHHLHRRFPAWSRRFPVWRNDFREGDSFASQEDEAVKPEQVLSAANFIGDQESRDERGDNDNRFSPFNMMGKLSPIGNLAAGFYDVSTNAMLTLPTLGSDSAAGVAKPWQQTQFDRASARTMPSTGAARQLNAQEELMGTGILSHEDEAAPEAPNGGLMMFSDRGHARSGLDQPDYEQMNSANGHEGDDDSEDQSNDNDSSEDEDETED